MSEVHPLHGAVYGRVLMDDLEARGIAPETLLAGTGVKPADLRRDEAWLPFDKLAALFERAAELTNDDLLGLHRGIKRHAKRIGAWAYVGLAAPTLQDLLKNAARYSRVFSDAAEIDVSALEQTGCVHWRFLVTAQVKRRQFIEFGAAGFLAALRQWTGREIVPLSVTLIHPRNSGMREFEKFFGCPIRFGAATNSIAFSPGDLTTPLLTADEHLLKILQEHCENILRQKGQRASALTVRLERAIADRLAAGEAKQDIIAHDMGMSRRSLSRHLEAEKTSFHAILDGLRHALADNYLRDSDLPQSEIAFLLGYASVSSFSAAYKRWTGVTPGHARVQFSATGSRQAQT